MPSPPPHRMDGLQPAPSTTGPTWSCSTWGCPTWTARELLRMLRAVSRVPVIVATARDDEAEIVRVLDAGADDYVVKPFSAAQLDARIRAVLRARRRAGRPTRGRGRRAADRPARPGGDAGRRAAGADPARVRPAALPGRPGRQVVTKRELLTEVWQLPYGGADKTVDVHLSWLRRKLGETAAAAALPAHGTRRRGQAGRAGRREAPAGAAGGGDHLAGADRVPGAAGAAGPHGRRGRAR